MYTSCELRQPRSTPRSLQHALGVQLPFYVDRQALSRVLIDDAQQPQDPAIVERGAKLVAEKRAMLRPQTGTPGLSPDETDVET